MIGLLKAINESWVHLRQRRIHLQVVLSQLDLQLAFDEHG